MTAKDLFVSGIQIVLAVFGAFGSFLQKILPAQIDEKEFLYTYMQIVCLFVFLLIKFLLLKNKTSKFWGWFVSISVVLCFVSGFGYYLHSKNTLRSVGDSNYKAVNGDLSSEAKETCSTSPYKDNPIHQTMTCEEGLLSEADTRDLAWIYTRESVENNINIFTILYVILTLSLSVALFSLLELITARPNNSQSPPAPVL